jgi:hypothetical protein
MFVFGQIRSCGTDCVTRALRLRYFQSNVLVDDDGRSNSLLLTYSTMHEISTPLGDETPTETNEMCGSKLRCEVKTDSRSANISLTAQDK